MTDFGTKAGDMEKSTYDTDGDGVVDDSEKLGASSKAEVQDHTPKSHSHPQSDVTDLGTDLAGKAATTHEHVETDITDLDHDAQKIKGVTVDDGDKGGGKVLTYNATSENMEYETPSTGGDTIVDRGDPSANDFVVGDLTTDGTWRDLDLSSIVPVNTKAVILRTIVADDAAGSWISYRKKGNNNAPNALTNSTQVANTAEYVNGVVFCDGDRKIEYNAKNVTFTQIDIVVCGWFV